MGCVKFAMIYLRKLLFALKSPIHYLDTTVLHYDFGGLYFWADETRSCLLPVAKGDSKGKEKKTIDRISVDSFLWARWIGTKKDDERNDKHTHKKKTEKKKNWSYAGNNRLLVSLQILEQ